MSEGDEEREEEREDVQPGDELPPPRQSRLGRYARKLLDRRELAEDTREALGALLESSDRAKTEMVRMVAREARHYLDELKLKDDLLELVTSHSLELRISMSLKPLEKALEDAPGEGSADRPQKRDQDEE